MAVESETEPKGERRALCFGKEGGGSRSVGETVKATMGVCSTSHGRTRRWSTCSRRVASGVSNLNPL